MSATSSPAVRRRHGQPAQLQGGEVSFGANVPGWEHVGYARCRLQALLLPAPSLTEQRAARPARAACAQERKRDRNQRLGTLQAGAWEGGGRDRWVLQRCSAGGVWTALG